MRVLDRRRGLVGERGEEPLVVLVTGAVAVEAFGAHHREQPGDIPSDHQRHPDEPLRRVGAEQAGEARDERLVE